MSDLSEGEERMLTAEDILDAPDIVTREVYVPEWKGKVKVRSFTLEEQQDWRTKSKVNGEVDENRVELLMFIGGVIEPKFSEDRAEQLRKKSAGAINRVNKVLLEISGLREGAVQESEKSFPDGRT